MEELSSNLARQRDEKEENKILFFSVLFYNIYSYYVD